MKVSVSYLKTPYTVEETIAKIEETSADLIHVDLKDGLFVDECNFAWEEIWPLLKNRTKPLDIHLMTVDVEHHIKNAKCFKPRYITFHLEASKYVRDCIALIKNMGSKCGIAISPETPIEELEPYIGKIDVVLVLSVTPGYGGQKFIPETIEKLKKLKEWQKENKFLIEVDGGINAKTISLVKEYADIVVSGSYTCESKDFETSILNLKNNS